MGYNKTLEFISVYAIEKGLSVDNMFVFLLIFSSLGIPHNYQHNILMTGILGAIGMRIALILAGVSLLESFHWMVYIFGGLLVFTWAKDAFTKERKSDRREEKHRLQDNEEIRPYFFCVER